MRASSMRALDKVAGEFSQRLAESGVEAAAWGKALFVMVDVLRHNSRLTNSLTDPGRPVTDKQELARGVFGTSAPAPAVDIVCQLVASRWSEAKDLAEAVEDLAVQALLAAAASQGQLEIIGRDLFAVTELLKEQRELRNALAEVRTRTATERVEILTRILQGKIHPYALTILKRMVDTSTGTGLRGRILDMVDWIGQNSQAQVVQITTATPLAPAQRDRLIAVLERYAGKPVLLNEAIDTQVVGGIHIRMGAEVIDGTVLNSLLEVERRLAG